MQSRRFRQVDSSKLFGLLVFFVIATATIGFITHSGSFAREEGADSRALLFDNGPSLYDNTNLDESPVLNDFYDDGDDWETESGDDESDGFLDSDDQWMSGGVDQDGLKFGSVSDDDPNIDVVPVLVDIILDNEVFEVLGEGVFNENLQKTGGVVGDEDSLSASVGEDLAGAGVFEDAMFGGVFDEDTHTLTGVFDNEPEAKVGAVTGERLFASVVGELVGGVFDEEPLIGGVLDEDANTITGGVFDEEPLIGGVLDEDDNTLTGGVFDEEPEKVFSGTATGERFVASVVGEEFVGGVVEDEDAIFGAVDGEPFDETVAPYDKHFTGAISGEPDYVPNKKFVASVVGDEIFVASVNDELESWFGDEIVAGVFGEEEVNVGAVSADQQLAGAVFGDEDSGSVWEELQIGGVGEDSLDL